MSETIENLSKEYIQAFRQKNLLELENLFADNIRVVDWEIDIQGKQTVLNELKRVFSSIKDLEIPGEIISAASSENIVYVELKIQPGIEETLHLLDVITFNDDNKIVEVHGHKIKDVSRDVMYKKKLAEYRKRDPFIYR